MSGRSGVDDRLIETACITRMNNVVLRSCNRNRLFRRRVDLISAPKLALWSSGYAPGTEPVHYLNSDDDDA
jgi:hypothetical protein